MPKVQTTPCKYKPSKRIQASKRTRLSDEYRPGFLDELDGRTNIAKELRARLATLQNDLGGPQALSYQQQSLCLRAIHLEARIEAMEIAQAQGEQVEFGSWVQAINSLIGLFKTLGLEKHSREVNDLHTYLSKRAKEGRS